MEDAESAISVIQTLASSGDVSVLFVLDLPSYFCVVDCAKSLSNGHLIFV